MRKAALLLCLCARVAAAQPPERLTLDQAVARAMARHPDIETARAEVLRAEGLLREVRSAALPTLIPTATYTRLDSARVIGTAATGNTTLPTMGTSGAGVIANADQLSASAPLSIPLLVPARWAEWAHARDQLRVAELALPEVRRQVAIAVADAYLSVITQQRLVETTTVSRDSARAHADYTKLQWQNGRVAELDSVRAEQQVHRAEAELQNAAVGLGRAQEALGVLVAGDHPCDAAVEPHFQLPVTDHIAQRPDIVRLDMQVTAASHRVRDDYTDYSPYLTALFQPTYTEPPTFAQPRWSWQLSVTLVVPLYDGGYRSGLQRERQAGLDEARINLEASLRRARADLRYGDQAIRQAEARVREGKLASTLAHRALDIAALRYREGATTNLEVVDAETDARNADLALALAEDAAQRIRLDLMAAAGAFP